RVARRSGAPERLGVEQPTQMLAQFRLAMHQPMLVPVQHPLSGLGDRAVAGAGACQPGEDVVPDADVVGLAEIILQPLQSLDEALDRPALIEAGEQLRTVAQLLQRDAQAVALLGRLAGETLAALSRDPPPVLEEARRDRF